MAGLIGYDKQAKQWFKEGKKCSAETANNFIQQVETQAFQLEHPIDGMLTVVDKLLTLGRDPEERAALAYTLGKLNRDVHEALNHFNRARSGRKI